jgi:hypothetical protein
MNEELSMQNENSLLDETAPVDEDENLSGHSKNILIPIENVAKKAELPNVNKYIEEQKNAQV